MRVDLLDYELPEELIASRPPETRDGARLLSVRENGLEDHRVLDLPTLIPRGSLLIVNDTRVLPARLFGAKIATGGKVELLLLKRLEAGSASDGVERERWTALGKSSKPFRAGDEIAIDGSDGLGAEIIAKQAGGQLEVRLHAPAAIGVTKAIENAGHMPLPPYVKRPDDGADRERYQTVFARVPGAVAAPTAGLHLSESLLEALRSRGVETASVTLHVGLGTFKPVTTDDLDQHPMHEEWREVPEATVDAIAQTHAAGHRVIAIGTTVIRALESSIDATGALVASSGETSILIQPGHRFRVADSLVTNFHLPRSTLLALVSAFAGRSRIIAAYEHAVRAKYRFFSYGDAMILHDRAAPESASA